MIKVYFDLDGVLADFDAKTSMNGKFSSAVFRREVMEEKIFENLEPMLSGFKLLKELEKFDVTIEILSSLGSPHSEDMQLEVAEQKKAWLANYGLGHLTANFVTHKGKKKLFATPHSILIDDTIQNIYDWNENGGLGMFYINDMYYAMFYELNGLLKQIADKRSKSIY